MTKIENETQYRRAVERVDELLPLVNDTTPTDDKNYVELVLLSNLVADYSDEHFALEPPKLIDIIKLRMYETGITTENKVISQKLNIAPETALGLA